MTQFVRPLLLVAVGVVVGLALSEAGFRLYESTRPVPHPPRQRGFFWEPNPDFGWSHPAGREGQWWNDEREFLANVQINSKGLRDVEHEYEKPAGVFRILILGDSYIEAIQVELEQSFPRLLEGLLNTDERRVEVINGGVSDWGTDNELLYFLHEGFKYEPDLVLLAFDTANDVRNNSPVLNTRVPYIPIKKPTFTLRGDGELELHPVPPVSSPPPPAAPPRSAPWWHRFRVAKFLVDRLALTRERAPSVSAPPSNPPPSAMSTDMLVYSPNYTAEVDEAWRITKALIRKLRTAVQDHSAELAMVLVNGPWAHYDMQWNLQLRLDPIAQKTWIRHRPNDELNAFLRSERIRAIDLLAPFDREKSKQRLFFNRDPHWTVAAHRLAASTVAEFLTSQGLVPRSGSED